MTKEPNAKDIARAVKVLFEALQSDHLTPYVESRIRQAIMFLGRAS